MRNLNKKRALDCIEKMEEFDTLHERKVGRVLRDFPQPYPNYLKGDYVIIRDEEDDTYTVEIPLSLESINVRKTGYICTMGTLINVPRALIKERRLMNMRRRILLLLIAGLALIIGGAYAVDHIDAIFAGQSQSAKLLAGLGIGALPFIIGVFIMVSVVIFVIDELREKRRSAKVAS